MQEDLLEYDESQIKWTDREVFQGFFTRPKKTFDYIIDQYYNKYVVLIMVLYGIVRNVSRAFEKGMPDTTTVVIAVILGGLFGWIGVYIVALLFVTSGRWLGGGADVGQVVRIFSYSTLPSIISSIILLIIIIIYQSSNTTISINNLDIASVIYLLFMAGATVGYIWSLVLLVIGMSRVQTFTIGKSILNIVLGFLLFIAIIMSLVGIISLLSLTP